MDIGSVLGEIGILPEYREGYRNPPGAIWAIVGLSGKEKELPKVVIVTFPFYILSFGEHLVLERS